MSNITRQECKAPVSWAVVALALAPGAVVIMMSIAFASFKATEEAPKATLVDCQAIQEAQGRLACYDMLAKEQKPMPAKGGQAILSSP